MTWLSFVIVLVGQIISIQGDKGTKKIYTLLSLKVPALETRPYSLFLKVIRSWVDFLQCVTTLGVITPHPPIFFNLNSNFVYRQFSYPLRPLPGMLIYNRPSKMK